MGYADQFALRRSQVFRDKVGKALLNYARDLRASNSTTPVGVVPVGKTLTWTRAQEVAWATSVISPLIDRWVDHAIIAVITNDAIAGAGEAAPDDSVLWMVTQIMPDLLRVEVR